jgi:hypothetical protein
MLAPQCMCGTIIQFRRGQKEKRCPVCRSYCYKTKAGYWSVNSNGILFTPRERFLRKERSGE